MASSVAFFAFMSPVTPPPYGHCQERLVFAAVIASTLGILGYFDVAGLGAHSLPVLAGSGDLQRPKRLCHLPAVPGVMLVQGFLLETIATNSFP